MNKQFTLFALLPPLIITISLILALFDIYYVFRIPFALVSIGFIPGYLVLKKLRVRLEFYEVVPISSALSMAILMFISFYLSFFPYHITAISVLSGLLLFTIVLWITTFLFKGDHNDDDFKTIKEHSRDFFKKLTNNKENVLLILLLVVMPVFLLSDDLLRYKYFHGFDAYTTKPLTLSIVQDTLDPFSFLEKHKMFFSGFHFFNAALHVSTGIPLYEYSKLGGVIFLSLLSVILFVIMYRIFDDKLVAIIPFFYMTNPFVIDRFLMTITENFSLIFLASLIFFLLLIHEEQNKFKNKIFISAIFFGAIFSTHPLALIFASFIITSFVLVSLLRKKPKHAAYLILIFSGFIFAFPILEMFLRWFIWLIEFQLQQFLGSGIIPTPPWELGEQEILSAWVRDIYTQDFSILEIMLLPLGVISIILDRKILRIKHLFFIIPWSGIILILYFGTKIGFFFTPARLNIYIAILIGVLSGIGIIKIILTLNKHLPKELRLVLTYPNRKISVVLNKRVLMKFLMISIIAPVFLFNSIIAIEYNKWSPYESSQVEGIKWLKQYLINQTDAIVIPSPNDITLVEYVGIENALSNRTLIDRIMTAVSYDELNHLLSAYYPNKKDAYFVISQRWINSYEESNNFTLLKLLDEYADKMYPNIESQSVTIFKFELYKAVLIIKDDDSEIDNWVGIAFDDRKAMKILFLEKDPNISSVHLSMNLKKRDFDESGAYEGNWSLVINGYNHTYSWDDIPEGGGWIKKEIPTSEILEGENQIIILKQSPDHIFIGLDTDTDFNHSAFYSFGEWDYEKLGKWYGTFNGEYMIRLLVIINE